MPAWPSFNTTPMRSTYRAPPRTDRRAMQALHQWFVWSRTSTKQTHAVRIVAELVDSLPERERQCLEAWLAGSLDRDIGERLGVPIEFAARVRIDALLEVGLRLARKPARVPALADW